MPWASQTHVLLIRHGATTASLDDRFAGSSDVDLSDQGRRQIAALAERLRKTKIDAAYSSDMRRAVETCRAAVKYHNLEPTQLKAFREIDHGMWEGVVHKEVEEKFAADYAQWTADPLTFAPPGGETGMAVLGRALPALRQIVKDHAGKTVVIVSHKATNRLLIAYLLGMDVRRYRDRISQDLACLNVLEFQSPTEARVMLLNDVSHHTAIEQLVRE